MNKDNGALPKASPIFRMRRESEDFTDPITAGHISIHGLPTCTGTRMTQCILE